MTEILEYASNYLKRGWRPLPLQHQSKSPNLKGWQNMILSELDLPQHFNGNPQNIGILLGSKSKGLTDIDLDSSEAIKIADCFLPETDAVFGRASKPRSHRLYYCKDAAFEKFNNPFLVNSSDEAERKRACIVELRTGDGMQTVFPPSVHPSGEAIEWTNEGEPTQVEARELYRAVALLASAALVSTFWRNGVRNELNLALSGALLRNGFDVLETKNFIRAVCIASNDEELAERLNTVDATAQKLERGENVYGFPKLAELTDTKLVETICKWFQIEHRNENNIDPIYQIEMAVDFTTEPKPLDLTLKPVKKVEDYHLPNVLVNWLRPASKVIGCPFDFLALSAIVMAGSVIGSRIRVKALRNSDWYVVPNLYAGLVGLPSTKKTPALDEARKPILELQAKAREEFQRLKGNYEIKAKFYEKQSNKLLSKAISLEEYETEMENLGKPEQPIQRRFETNDITTPKLIQFLSENPNGLMLFRDELTGWLKSLEADYDKSARPFTLDLWKGGITYELARADGREIQLDSGTLSIIGGIQPSKLQKYISEAYSFDNSDGFAQRFLFAYPDTSRKNIKPTEEDYQAMKKGFLIANKIFKKLAQYDFNGKVISANNDKFFVVKFNGNSQNLVDRWIEHIQDQAKELEVDDEVFASFLYKLPKNCFAVALIFHCLENIEQEEFPDEISVQTTWNALRYITVLRSHAERVFALGENQIFTLAKKLIGKLKKGELKHGFTQREVARKQWSGLRIPETVKDVLALLVDYGYLKDIQLHGSGRPTVKYYIHPSLESEVTENDGK